MPKPLYNEFTETEFSEEEDLLSRSLNAFQEAAIQNDLVFLVRQRFAIQYAPTNPLLFLREIAMIEGKTFILRGLLESSEQAKKILTERAFLHT